MSQFLVLRARGAPYLWGCWLGVCDAPLPPRTACTAMVSVSQQVGSGSVGGVPVKSLGILFTACLPPNTRFVDIRSVPVWMSILVSY